MTDKLKNEWHLIADIIQFLPEFGHFNLKIVESYQTVDSQIFSGIVIGPNSWTYKLEEYEYRSALRELFSNYDILYVHNKEKNIIEIEGIEVSPESVFTL